jgi:hypothetical protein
MSEENQHEIEAVEQFDPMTCSAAGVEENAARRESIERGVCPECGGDVIISTCNNLCSKYCTGLDCYWCA